MSRPGHCRFETGRHDHYQQRDQSCAEGSLSTPASSAASHRRPHRVCRSSVKDIVPGRTASRLSPTTLVRKVDTLVTVVAPPD